MAKVRIYVLAKELEVQPKDVIRFLGEHDIETKSASSSVEEDTAELVRKHFRKDAPKGEEADHGTAKPDATKPDAPKTDTSKPKEEGSSQGAAKQDAVQTGTPKPQGEGASQGAAKQDTPKAEGSTQNTPNPNGKNEDTSQGVARPDAAQQGTPKPDAAQANAPKPGTSGKAGDAPEKKAGAPKADQKGARQERPKKKSSITAVFNPQNSKLGGGHRQKNAKDGRPDGQRPAQPGQNRQEQNTRTASERAEATRAMFDRILGGDKAAARQEAHPQDANPQGAYSQEANPQEAYTQEARTQQPEREHGARKEHANRGERLARGERPQQAERPRGERGQQGQGRARSNDRGNRNEGERNNGKNIQNGRPNNARPQGDKNGQKNGGGRPKEQRSRFEQEINKMNQNTPAVADEPRKESRDGRRGTGSQQKQDRERGGGPRRQERLVNLEKSGGKKKKQQQQQQQQPAPMPQAKEEETIRTLVLPETITVKELADKLKVQASAIVKKLFLQGTMVTVNQEIDFELAEEIALEYNCICEMEEKVDVIEELLKEEEEDESKMVKRPPVVCVMGHVDHGKTSLLDAIRNTNVIEKEAGGITQHIGAYTVNCNGEKITFLDTPGHEAFTAMRMRGANSTDIAILVVAADDGVMPQTVEAISHAKAAGVEIIVAINKIDKPSANVERVKQELSEYDLIPEDWGGSTVFVPVSAHTHEGIDNLLEMILLTAEVMELKANPKRLARGLVIEAQLDKGRGAVATVLVQKGTLKVGQPIAAGSCSGKVRAMIDDKGRRVKEAGPSMPVEILGLNSVPNAGDIFVSTETEKEAKNFADTFISQGREKLLEETKSKMSLDDLFSQIQSGNVKELGIIVKADVQGSVEAVKQSLLKLSNEEVVVKVIHGGVGAINESDVSLASASNAIIIGFNVRPDVQAKASAEREGVDIRLYKVIYDAIEDVQAAMKGMLDPIFEEKVLGHGEIRQVFKSSGVGNIAGSYVLDGMFMRGCKVRVFRGDEQLYDGELASLKRFKDDVKEVKAGFECGLVFDGFHDFQEMDTIEAYTMVEIPR